MKISGVNVTRHAAGCTVQLASDAGVTGVGIRTEGVAADIERLVEATLLGEDPRAVTQLWQRMAETQAPPAARAILDVALWDLKARHNGEPLWRTLGGSRPRANTHAGVGEPDWYRRMARDYGVRGGTLRMSRDEERDLQRLERMREALRQAGSEPLLSLDAAGSWSAQEAIRRMRAIEERFDVAWITGVSSSADAADPKQISSSIAAAVCVGRDLGSLAEFLPHFRERSADLIEIDIGLIGITGALQLADAAYGYELPVVLAATPGNIAAHLSGAMPYFMSLEVADPATSAPFYSTDVRIEQGCAIAGDAPGHGLQPIRQAVA